MRTIGTDISLDVCKAEGYMMIQFDARKKFKKDEEYRIFAHAPDYIEELKNEVLIDVFYSFNELIEMYEEDKKSIDQCCGTERDLDFNNPNFFDFLNLASDINSYKGLN
jgi:hypothetical protein